MGVWTFPDKAEPVNRIPYRGEVGAENLIQFPIRDPDAPHSLKVAEWRRGLPVLTTGEMGLPVPGAASHTTPCPDCHCPMVWHGSIARGALRCPLCQK